MNVNDLFSKMGIFIPENKVHASCRDRDMERRKKKEK
jgi:hypothetical protein